MQLTELGIRVSAFPLTLRNSCMLMHSFDSRFSCSREIVMLVSMLEVYRDLFTSTGLAVLKSKKKAGCKEGDFLTLINYFLRFFNCKITDRKRVCG